MILIPYGENAMIVQFEQKIEETIHAKVMDLYHWILQQKLVGLSFCIPAYCSLTIGFNSSLTDFQTLKAIIESDFNAETESQISLNTSTLHIPVCYEKPFALDLEEVCKMTQLSVEEIIQLHTSYTFRVYMLGFVMGFPYLGTLPESLYCIRKAIPLLRVPAQSIAIAGNQTGIYPIEISGGWQIIGRTPIPIFDALNPPFFLLQSGDVVRFYAISTKEFETITSDIQKRTFSKAILYEPNRLFSF